MLEYTCVGGKLVRGITVVTATQHLTKNDEEFEKVLDSSIRLGWAIEIVNYNIIFFYLFYISYKLCF